MKDEEENKRIESEYQKLTEEEERQRQLLSQSENRVESVRSKLKEIKKHE